MRTYNKKNIPLAKQLRKSMTEQERKLWYVFLRSYPIKFYRQRPINNYIADFYCSDARLVIELDGGGNYFEMQIIKDAERTKNINSLGIDVLRICNTDINKNFKTVCEYIHYLVQKRIKE